MMLLPLLLLGSLLEAQAGPVFIRNVTVIPATGAASIPGSSLLINRGRIERIGPRLVPPAGARVVDGTGKFLIPGLFEMHSHVSKARASSLGLFVAHGVTTIRDMGGDHQELIRWRSEVQSGRRVGPRMLIAGPYLESADNARRQHRTPVAEMAEPVERTRIGVGSPADADRIVDSIAQFRPDFLKIRTVQDRATWFAIVAAARRHGLKVVGHASAGPEVVAQSGQASVEHGFYGGRLDTLPLAERMLRWRALAAAGIAVVPTLATVTQSVLPPHQHLAAMVDDSSGRIEPRRRYLSRFMLIDWKEQLAEDSEDRRAFFRQAWDPALMYLREMHSAGVRLLPGTDVAVLNIFPGSTLHDELANFVGLLRLTSAQALESATRHAAEFLGLSDSLGTVATGKVADLVLLDGDPLADIRNLAKVSAVILRGVYLDRSALDALLQATEVSPDRQVNDWPRHPRN